MRVIRDIKYTVLGVALGGIAYFAILGLDLDLFERVTGFILANDALELDELSFLILPALAGVMADVFRRAHAQRIETQKLKTFRETMREVHHIMNNFLNQIQYIRLLIEENDSLPPENLRLMDQIINEAAVKLRELSHKSSDLGQD